MGRLWQMLFAAAFGAFLLQTVRIEGFLFIPGLNKQLAAEQKAHRDTKANYARAQDAAQHLEDVRLAFQQAVQEKTNAEAATRLNSRLAGLDAVYQRLRGEARGGVGGAPGGQQVRGVPTAASGTDPAAGEDGFSLAERYEASTYAAQLDELISWVVGTASHGERPPDSVGTHHGDDDDLPDAAGRPSPVPGEGQHPSQ